MFERYTQEARRVIFFARYEAGNYGSPYIETEHLLLGLLREDQASAKWFPGESNVEPRIRSEIEKRITRGNTISTSVEIPLGADCKQVLNLALESSERLGHRQVETEHILLGILRVETSLAAQILIARGVKPGLIQEHLAKEPSPKNQGFLAELSQSEKEIVLQCMKAIVDGPEIEDWEFHTRLGIFRPTLRRIISVWPEIDDRTKNSDEFLAVNNCLNEVCHGFDIPPTEWGKWFTYSKDEITQTYTKWLRLRGGHSGGIR
jgi:hypothetical protein